MNPTRRSLILGAAATIITAPAIVRAASIMRVHVIEPDFVPVGRVVSVDIDHAVDALRYVIESQTRIPKRLLFCTTLTGEQNRRGYELIPGDLVRWPAYSFSYSPRRQGKSAMLQLEHIVDDNTKRMFNQF